METKEWTAKQKRQILLVCSFANQYTNISLKKFSFKNCNCDCKEFDIFAGAKEPFVNLVELEWETDWKLATKHLKRLFPKVQQLDLGSYSLSSVEQHLPELKCLKLNPLLTANLNKAFRLNPQLRVLHLPHAGYQMRFIRSASELLPSLEYLDLWLSDIPADTDRFHFKSVKKFRYNHAQCSGSIPFSFEKLEQFECINGMRHKYGEKVHEHIYYFVKKHRSIVELTACKEFFEMANILELLPLLQKVTVVLYGPHDTFDAISLLNKLKTLKEIYFVSKYPNNLNNVAEQLKICAMKWKITQRITSSEESILLERLNWSGSYWNDNGYHRMDIIGTGIV